MEIKRDTREKFTVWTPQAAEITDNIAANIEREDKAALETEPRNAILNLEKVELMDEAAAGRISSLQQLFYDNNASFVICCLHSTLETALDDMEILELLNTAPTESEAWDIVQLEEIERELLDDDEPLFNDHRS